MSGSPIYVVDDGVAKLIGALSYGHVFTLGGTGLATPIEYMAAIIEDAFPVGALAALRRPARRPRARTRWTRRSPPPAAWCGVCASRAARRPPPAWRRPRARR